jgi:peptidoglycan/LPS O-acetylase OafA/YrhL
MVNDIARRSPSLRWLRTSLTTLGAAILMLADAIAMRVAHEPKIDFMIFIVLMVLCGVSALVLGSVGIAKLRSENRRLVTFRAR